MSASVWESVQKSESQGGHRVISSKQMEGRAGCLAKGQGSSVSLINFC